MNTIRLGVVGLGCRGKTMTKMIAGLDHVTVTALCDVYDDRVKDCAAMLAEKPVETNDYRELLHKDLLDAVYIATPWESHVSIAIDFLKAGVAVALEVGGAQSIDELWELVRVWEKTKTPFMLMENCCYDKYELLATAMARKDLFGEIVQCSGAYGHDLRDEVAHGKENRHYRLRHYLAENCENYPTHELGPIAKLLDINRGNRMTSLVSVASKAAGMRAYVEKNADTVDPALRNQTFNQGDIVDTIITCENGETIRLKLDTTLPRSYDREFTVRGTKGLYMQSLNYAFFDGMQEDWVPVEHNQKHINNAAAYENEYLPDMWKNITDEQKKSGHGGMDGFMFKAFIETLRSGKEMPIDVYDCAAWMCVTALSAQSILNGGAPQPIPDFTCGQYKTRPRKDVIEL